MEEQPAPEHVVRSGAASKPATTICARCAYYPRTAQCTARVFDAQGWTGCLAASTAAARRCAAGR